MDEAHWDELPQKPSKSQRRREALDVLELAKELLELPPKRLATLPLEPAILEEFLKTQKLQKIARKRQLQYIAKRLRGSDLEPLKEKLARP